MAYIRDLVFLSDEGLVRDFKLTQLPDGYNYRVGSVPPRDLVVPIDLTDIKLEMNLYNARREVVATFDNDANGGIEVVDATGGRYRYNMSEDMLRPVIGRSYYYRFRYITANNVIKQLFSGTFLARVGS